MRRIPQPELDSDRRGSELVRIIQSLAIVVAVGADGIDDQAVVSAAETQRVPIEQIEGDLLHEAGLREFLQRVGPPKFSESKPFGCQTRGAAGQVSVSSLFSLSKA